MDKDARSSLTTSGTESTPSHRNMLHIDDRGRLNHTLEWRVLSHKNISFASCLKAFFINHTN